MMKIRSSDRLSFVSLALQDRLSRPEALNDCCLAIELSCKGFGGRDDKVWFSSSEIDRFLGNLFKLERERCGTAVLQSMGRSAGAMGFHLEISIRGLAKQAFLSVELERAYYDQNGELCPLSVSVGFEIDPGDLLSIVADFEALFRD